MGKWVSSNSPAKRRSKAAPLPERQCPNPAVGQRVVSPGSSGSTGAFGSLKE